MSEAAATTSPRQRGSGGGRQRQRRRGPRKPAAERTEGEKEGSPREARAPRVSLPVPPEFFGTSKEGKISHVKKENGVDKFGFIYIGEGSEDLPRIYFNSEEWKEADFVARKGYSVSFVCAKDERDRAFASGVKLTAAGKVQAAEREANIAQSNSERKASGIEDVKREPRERRERRPRRENTDTRTVTLKVTCAGFPGEKEVIANLGESIGKLKHAATSAFEAPITQVVYCKGALLTRQVLTDLKDGDSINLAEPVPVKA